MRNLRLKTAIFAAGESQRSIAKKTGISESFLSMAVQGKYLLSGAQMDKIAAALGKATADLFDGDLRRGGARVL